MKATANKFKNGDAVETLTANGWIPATFVRAERDKFGGRSVHLKVAGGFGCLDTRPEWVRRPDVIPVS